MAKEWAKGFYNSKQWQDTRRIVLKRDGYCCVDCGGRAEEIHHKQELTADNINDISISLNLDNLVSLCHDCHTKRTKNSNSCQDKYIFDDNGQLVPYYPPSSD